MDFQNQNIRMKQRTAVITNLMKGYSDKRKLAYTET
jgi:hypothetical protein